ncbi:glycosyl transferase family 25 [Labrenzia sp. EL_208]|nr:glycosyl transferase family 25 [Labrenzia sp. EL_132]MBG6229552.1 glycosyl transferase family 25 [Labrenzia sp. EL_208]
MDKILAKKNLAYKYFDAIDGKAGGHPLFVRHDARLAEIRYGFKLAPGELGCYASHFLLWKMCVREKRPLLIMEDDIELTDEFQEALKIADWKIQDYGLLRLSSHKKRNFMVREEFGSRQKIVQFAQNPSGTSCYAISPWAAAKFLEHASVWFEPVDCLLDRYWDHGVGCYAIYPFSVKHIAQTNEQSEIWDGVARGPRSSKSKKYPVERRYYRLKDNLMRKIYKIKNGLRLERGSRKAG